MPDQKHILFISSWYPNQHNPTHGIFNLYFARAAALYNKVSVINVCSERDLKQKREFTISREHNILTVEVFYRKVKSTFPILSQLIKRTRVLASFEEAYHHVTENAGKPDLIQLNVIMPMGIGALYLAHKYRIPYVINENWSGYCEEDGNYRGLLQQFFTRKIVKGANAIMPTSSYLMDAMLKHGLTGNYRVIPNVVDVSVFKPLERQENKNTRLIHISSLNDREKNVSAIIRAFHGALQQNPHLELVIVGEGTDRSDYEELTALLGLQSSITFTGRLVSKALVNEINKADALIMFSNYETFCLVIIEAFACGKPVITSNAGAIRTYMQPKLGIMVNKGVQQELLAAILEFASTKHTYNSVEIRNFAVANYSYETVGKQLDEIYRRVLTEMKKVAVAN